MRYEWDESKSKRNIEKHGVSFYEATTVFYDSDALTFVDDRFSYSEVRFITIGEAWLTDEAALVVVVVHTDRAGTTRIISARKASRKERARYEQQKEVR